MGGVYSPRTFSGNSLPLYYPFVFAKPTKIGKLFPPSARKQIFWLRILFAFLGVLCSLAIVADCTFDRDLFALETIDCLDTLQEVDMTRSYCCPCSVARHGTCENCVCVKEGRKCTDCLVSRQGACLNFCSDEQEVKEVNKVLCPFTYCTSGKYGTRMSIRAADISRLRNHLSDHIVMLNLLCLQNG